MPARTLAETLRGWDEAALAFLLRERPDLASPVPHDSTQLASRAAARASVHRALDSLDHLTLATLDALTVFGTAPAPDVVAVVHADPTAVGEALRRILRLALAWPTEQGIRALSTVPEALRAGTGRGTAALWPRTADPRTSEEIGARVAALSPQATALLSHLDANGGAGSGGRARRTVSHPDARTPVEELIALGLLVPRDNDLLVVPGEVALHLRGGRTTRDPQPPAPQLLTSHRDPALVERAAAGAAFEFVRRTDLVLEGWGSAPPGVLRSGGLSVRELRALARDLHVSEPGAALLVEVAAEAGLLAEGVDGEGNTVWVPTAEFDVWSEQSLAQRWLTLAAAWLVTARIPHAVGTADAAGRSRNALTPELASPMTVEARRTALGMIAQLPPGAVLAAGTGVASVVERARWLRPRRPAGMGELVAAAIDEASEIGLMGAGGLSAAGRALLGDNPEVALAEMAAHLPTPVDHLLLQADLTAVAPGPLASDVVRALHALADVESRGGATVYRFSPTSVRRAFDAGWSAAEIHTFLGDVSRTPVPQPLAYLVDDVARTFGTVRVGRAESFLRSEDEAALRALVADPRAATLGLRLLAPTVAISAVPLDVLLPRLRELGTSPVLEAPDGTVRVARPDLLRARRSRSPRPAATIARVEAGISAVIAAVRAGDSAAARSAAPREHTSPSGALAALREAIEGGGNVRITYLDARGVGNDLAVRPLQLEGGRLSAHDHHADTRREFALHRITAVRPALD